MKIKWIAHLLLVFAAFCNAAFAQDKKLAEASFYETKIEFSKGEIDSGLSVELFLKILFTRAVTPAGIALSEDEKVDDKFELLPQVLTFREWLDFFVKTKPDYKWEEKGGVINIFPVKSYAILNTQIPEFVATNQFSNEIVDKLTETREFQEYLGKRQIMSGLKSNGLRDIDKPYSLGSKRLGGGLDSTPKASFNLKNETFSEILNEIIRRNGKRLWVYYEYRTVENYQTYELRIL
jgi:hypothetical protein